MSAVDRSLSLSLCCFVYTCQRLIDLLCSYLHQCVGMAEVITALKAYIQRRYQPNQHVNAGYDAHRHCKLERRLYIVDKFLLREVARLF